MEKKAYIQPMVTIVTVGPQNMIALSGTNVEGLDYEGNTDGEIEEAGVKGNFGWDDVWD